MRQEGYHTNWGFVLIRGQKLTTAPRFLAVTDPALDSSGVVFFESDPRTITHL